MKCILIALVLLPATCLASERLKMSQEFSGEQEASNLLESAARSASSGDFNGFIKCFTRKYASGIRRKMKAAISGRNIGMEILDIQVQSCDENTINMRAKYFWNDGSGKAVLTSDIVARLEDGSWKIASESVVSTKRAENSSPVFNFGGGGQVAFSNDENVLPLDMARTKEGGCVGGRCEVPQPNPNQGFVRPNLDILPLDIARRPGGGCANGRCLP